MPDQVPVVPADGAVAAAVDPPVVAPPPPADAAVDNNAQNANDNVVPAPQPAAPEVSVFSCPCIRFPSRVFRARRCWSFSLVLASVLLVLVFASVYKFTVFASVLLFYFPVCVTTLVWRLCANLVFASVYNFSFPSVWQV